MIATTDIFCYNLQISKKKRLNKIIPKKVNCVAGIELREKFTLPQSPGCSNDKSMSIVFFFILESLDTYIRQNTITLEQYGLPPNIGPLNKNGNTLGCFVYIKERSSFLDGAYS